MTLKDYIKNLENPASITIENEEMEFICITITSSEGIKPYLNREVSSWRLPGMEGNPRMRSDLIFVLKNEHDNNTTRYFNNEIVETYSEEPPIRED